MARQVNKRDFGGNPPMDFLDLSYVMPKVVSGQIGEKADQPVAFGSQIAAEVRMLQLGGRPVRRVEYERFSRRLFVSEDEVLDLNGDMYSRWVTRQYPNAKRKHIVIGPPVGSVAYLAGLLDAPFLPTSFAAAVSRPKMDPDEIRKHAEFAKKIAERFTKKDPNIEIISEYDPIHQRLRTLNATTLRFRYLTLPEAYRKFITTNLAPGGTLIFIESRMSWRQYRLADRVYHQTGVPGGIPADEFIGGSKRIEQFHEMYTMKKMAYRLPAKMETLTESRYGVAPLLRLDIQQFSRDSSRDVCQLMVDDIYQLSSLTSQLYIAAARREGVRPKYFYIHSGMLVAPQFCFATSTIPVWMPIPCFQGMNMTRDLLAGYPFELEEILVSFEPSVEEAPDFLQLERWMELMEERSKVRFIGMDRRLYPWDMSPYFRNWQELRTWARKKQSPLDMRISIDNIITHADACGMKYLFTQNRPA